MFYGNARKIPFSRRSIRTRFAFKFSRALKKLNQKRTNSETASPLEAHSRRCHMVKMAAYASLASAAGSRRTWTRALLWKIRNKRLLRNDPFLTNKRTKTARTLKRERRRTSRFSSKEQNPNVIGGEEFDLDGLRRLVPGGDVMDTLSLFDETADYIKCLSIQVQIMRKFVHFHSG